LGATALFFGGLILLQYFTGLELIPVPPNQTAGIILLVIGGVMALGASIIDRKIGVKRSW
jgi:hypothetical protein